MKLSKLRRTALPPPASNYPFAGSGFALQRQKGFFLQVPINSYTLPGTKQRVNPVDTTKWKSVLVPIEVYKEIKDDAATNGRTISGQLRVMFDVYSKSREKVLDNSHKVAYK